VRDREETDEEEEAVVNPTRRVRRQGSRNSASFGSSLGILLLLIYGKQIGVF
jgi:hypothetical protein